MLVKKKLNKCKKYQRKIVLNDVGGENMKQYEKCKQYKVNNVKTVEEFLDKYMIQEKWNTMSQELKDNIIRSHKQDLSYFGFSVLWGIDSVTGNTVSFYK